MDFEWDETKRLANLEKHGIDFLDAMEMWQGNVFEVLSPQTGHGETRYLAIGAIHGTVVTVIFTWREGNRRLISARRARPHERKDYDEAFGRGRRRPH